MTLADILHRVGIRAPAEKVFQSLSEEQGLAGWWTKNVKALAEAGAIAQFRFGAHGFTDMKVAELSCGRRVRW
jgi:uncharacterized protein YndB with AHSA1/START domain